jgi:hypothetical protein
MCKYEDALNTGFCYPTGAAAATAKKRPSTATPAMAENRSRQIDSSAA